MPSTTYRIKINRGDTQFEAEGDKKFVLEMIERFGGESIDAASRPAPKSTEKSTPKPTAFASHSKGVSISEFVRQMGLKKHTDLVLAFGYYLEKNMGNASFTPADINACYYEAKLESSNTSQMIIQNIRRSFMMLAKAEKEKGRKAYTLTRSGEEHIEKSMSQSAK